MLLSGEQRGEQAFPATPGTRVGGRSQTPGLACARGEVTLPWAPRRQRDSCCGFPVDERDPGAGSEHPGAPRSTPRCCNTVHRLPGPERRAAGQAWRPDRARWQGPSQSRPGGAGRKLRNVTSGLPTPRGGGAGLPGAGPAQDSAFPEPFLQWAPPAEKHGLSPRVRVSGDSDPTPTLGELQHPPRAPQADRASPCTRGTRMGRGLCRRRCWGSDMSGTSVPRCFSGVNLFCTKVGLPLQGVMPPPPPRELSGVSPLAGVCCWPMLSQPTSGLPRGPEETRAGHPSASCPRAAGPAQQHRPLHPGTTRPGSCAVLTHGKPPPLPGSALSVFTGGRGAQGHGRSCPPTPTSESNLCYADGETAREGARVLGMAAGRPRPRSPGPPGL